MTPTPSQRTERLPITQALEQSDDPMSAPNWLLWRTGRSVGRTIYAQLGPESSKRDVLIGLMDTREIADEVVKSHNVNVERGQE